MLANGSSLHLATRAATTSGSYNFLVTDPVREGVSDAKHHQRVDNDLPDEPRSIGDGCSGQARQQLAVN